MTNAENESCRMRTLRIVADGYYRAYAANEPIVRKEVESEYAERLKAASFWQRYSLRREIAAEIDRRLNERAPHSALY